MKAPLWFVLAALAAQPAMAQCVACLQDHPSVFEVLCQDLAGPCEEPALPEFTQRLPAPGDLESWIAEASGSHQAPEARAEATRAAVGALLDELESCPALGTRSDRLICDLYDAEGRTYIAKGMVSAALAHPDAGAAMIKAGIYYAALGMAQDMQHAQPRRIATGSGGFVYRLQASRLPAGTLLRVLQDAGRLDDVDVQALYQAMAPAAARAESLGNEWAPLLELVSLGFEAEDIAVAFDGDLADRLEAAAATARALQEAGVDGQAAREALGERP